jgi:alkylhydroperoxidase family enzyme
VAGQGINDQTVQAILTDWRTAAIDEKLRATLGFLQKLTLYPTEIAAADVDIVRAASVSDQAIEDAIYVCFIFSVLARLADAFDFDLTTPARWQVGGKVFYWLGYNRTSIPG